MRIWHELLIPKLCRQHLLAMWREALGCYKIVTGEVDGGSYRNHPATKEFLGNEFALFNRLCLVRNEMLKRGYNPKPIFFNVNDYDLEVKPFTEWQSLSEQIAILKAKGCKCKV